MSVHYVLLSLLDYQTHRRIHPDATPTQQAAHNTPTRTLQAEHNTHTQQVDPMTLHTHRRQPTTHSQKLYYPSLLLPVAGAAPATPPNLWVRSFSTSVRAPEQPK